MYRRMSFTLQIFIKQLLCTKHFSGEHPHAEILMGQKQRAPLIYYNNQPYINMFLWNS